MVPNIFGADTEQRTITRVENNPEYVVPAVYYKKHDGEEQFKPWHKFLGCRDGYAFFQSIDFPDIVGYPLVLISDNEQHGTIISIDRGIIKTDTGEEFNAEDYDSGEAENTNEILI